MKNTKIKLLTATACLALVGTASAAWVYSGTATASANIGVKVASYASAGSITVSGADNYYLYLDKGSVSFKQKDESIKLVAKHNVPTGFSATGSETYTYTVSLRGIITDYVEFDGVVSTKGTDTDENSTTFIKTADITWKSGEAITLPNLKWKTDTDGSTTMDSFENVTQYTDFIETCFGIKVAEISDWDQNKDVDVAAELDFVRIDFKAVVA